MERRQILDGVWLSQVEGDYKRSCLGVYLAAPEERDTVTSTALIPYMLERGCRSCPDATLLKRKLNSLYGAGFTAEHMSVGMNRVILGAVIGVDGALVGEPGLALERARLALDVLFDPAVENDAFNEQWLEIEKEKLRESIRSVINDKRTYCLRRAREAFFGEEDVRSLPADGFEEDLSAITPESLYADYDAFRRRASIEVIYVGRPCPDLESMLRKTLSKFDIRPAARAPLAAVAPCEEKRVVLPMPVEQDKLALAFTAGEVLGEKELVALRLACALLGGTATSRLFTNVREKESLCYYAACSPFYAAGGGMLIDSGIDHKNRHTAREAILREWKLLAEKGATEKELTEAKLLFKNILGGVRDSAAAFASYCFTAITRYGRLVTPEEEFAMLEAVTNEEVMAVLGKMHLNASCLIEKKEG